MGALGQQLASGLKSRLCLAKGNSVNLEMLFRII